MTDIVERLRAQPKEDHISGCMGGQYTCDCGYDLKTEGLLEIAADEIERLTALLREAVLYDSQIIHMESWWRKARRALEPKP